MTDDGYRNVFDPLPLQARAATVDLISASLRGQTAEMVKVVNATEEEYLGALVHGSLNLYRGLALRLRTPTAVDLIDDRFAETSRGEPDRDRRLAAQLLVGHCQTSPVMPDNDADVALHDVGAGTFNAACDAAGEGFLRVFFAALDLWRGMLPEAHSAIGVQILHNVAAQLRPPTVGGQ